MSDIGNKNPAIGFKELMILKIGGNESIGTRQKWPFGAENFRFLRTRQLFGFFFR